MQAGSKGRGACIAPCEQLPAGRWTGPAKIHSHQYGHAQDQQVLQWAMLRQSEPAPEGRSCRQTSMRQRRVSWEMWWLQKASSRYSRSCSGCCRSKNQQHMDPAVVPQHFPVQALPCEVHKASFWRGAGKSTILSRCLSLPRTSPLAKITGRPLPQDFGAKAALAPSQMRARNSITKPNIYSAQTHTWLCDLAKQMSPSNTPLKLDSSGRAPRGAPAQCGA